MVRLIQMIVWAVHKKIIMISMVLMKIATRKLTLLRRLLHENHEYVIGMIVIDVFLVMDQELQEDDYEETKEEEFVASIVSNSCGKVF